MNVNIEELITINYELEGLLYLVLHRGEDTPQQIWSMINDKIDALREGIKISEEQDDAAQDSAADDTYNVNDAIAAEPCRASFSSSLMGSLPDGVSSIIS